MTSLDEAPASTPTQPESKPVERSPAATRARTDRRRRPSAWRVLGGVGVGLLVLSEILPLVWLVASSLKAPDEFFTRPIWALPSSPHWSNYSDAWTRGHMLTYFRNSVVATVPSIVLLLLMAVMAGFALEVLRWRRSNLVLLLFASGLMVPLQMILLPLATMYFRANLLNTPYALIITYVAFGLPLTVFMMAGYYRAMPRELIDAALVDGAGIIRTFWSISLPIVRNALLTIAVVQFFFIWNDILLTLTFIRDTDKYTLQMGVLNFAGRYGQQDWGPTFAFLCISTAPTLLLYLVLNRQILAGMSAGSVKG